MKRLILLLAILFTIGLSNVWAYNFSAVAPSGQTLYYNISGGNAVVTSQNWSSPAYSNLTGALVIPASVTYNGTTYSVTTIGDWAFWNCSGLTSVTIPNSVTSIGNNAFKGIVGVVCYCGSATGAPWGASMSCCPYEEGDFIFTDSTKTSIVEYIGTGSSVIIPNTVTTILSGSFQNNSNITHLVIGTSVTNIEAGVFKNMPNLVSVDFNAVNCEPTIIYDNYYSFSYPSSFFFGCPNFTTITFGEGVQTIPDAIFSDCSGLTSVTIPNSVTSIGDYAFSRCSSLTSVTIPNSVTTIGDYAFQSCSGLTNITIPNSVTSIGDYAFYGVRYISYCGSATGSPWGATRVGCFYEEGDFLFEDATKATILAYIGTGTSVTIPNSVTSIGDYAFNGCSGLTSVTIPNSVTSIGNYAFADCSGLTSVTIPNSVTSIGNGAFENCSGLTSVEYTGDIAGWCSIDFGNYEANPNCYAHNLTIGGSPVTGALVIPSGVSAIKNYAFSGCSNVDTLYYTAHNLTTTSDWGNSSSNYNSYGFRPMKLKHLVIGDSVQTLPDYVFYNQDSVTSVTMEGATPPTLGSDVFYGNASNRKIYVPCGAYENYYNAWTDYRSALSEPMVDMDVVLATEAERGSVVIIPLHGQEVRCDSTVVVCATANYGYHFDHWSTGSTQAQDTIAISGDTVITAYFAKNQYAITLLSDDESMGSVNGGGTFDYLDTIALTATATAEHHHFVRWSDGNRENPRQWVVTEDTAFTAYFAIDTHRVSVVSNNIARGMVEASGTEFVYGTPCTVTATAYSGFTFAGWSNGMTSNPYTFAVLNDVELTALFISEDEQLFTITVVSDNPVMGSVSGGGMAMSGGEVTIHAVANEGYHFVRWNDNNTNADRTVIVTTDITYTAYFESDTPIQYTITVVSNDTIMGFVTGSGSYDDGEVTTITATAHEGYHFVQWQDGNTDAIRTITVTADVTYTAYFAANQTQDIVDVKPMAVVKVMGDCITVEGAEGENVLIFDVMGRVIVNEPMAEGKRFRMSRNGVYMVKVGNSKAQKVVVVR